MEPNRKSNYSYIERVNDHRSCYRIKTNDGLKLELDKSEIGRFIPQKGMSVQIRLFNGTVLQEVFLNGICVVRRSPQNFWIFLPVCRRNCGKLKMNAKNFPLWKIPMAI